MKTQDQMVAELQATRLKLDQAVASQQLIGNEGYRLLMAAVAEEIRAKGKRLMAYDCDHIETNALRAEIRALNFFSRWSEKAAGEIQNLVKRMEGLQATIQRRHDQGMEPIGPDVDALLTKIRQFKTEVLSHE